MKKVINITLGSIVFAIEQDAYDALSSYLEEIKNNLGNNDDIKEVVDDIESAVAEKFIDRKRSEKVAVTTADVEKVILEMGSPSEFGEVSEGESVSEETNSKESATEIKKRLYRDSDNAVVAGIASGLARYFDIDPVIVRLIFVISIFFNGMGIFVYIILWLVVPIAKTTADKFAMRGESVTLKEISDRVRKNIEDLETTKGLWGKIRNVLESLFKVLGAIFKYLFVAGRYIGGFVLIIGGSLAVAGLVSTYSIVLLSEKTFIPADAQTALDIMLSSSLGILAIASSFIMMLIPLLVLVLVGGSLLAGRNMFTATKSITLAVVWIVAIVLATTTSVLQVQKVLPVIDPERFENGLYEIHVNVDDENIEFETVVTPPVEEDVVSAPPSDAPIDLPMSN